MDAGQFLRARPRLSRGPPALRFQGSSAAAEEPNADSGSRRRGLRGSLAGSSLGNSGLVSGAAAVTWTANRRKCRPAGGACSNAGEVWTAATEFKFVPATVRVIGGVQLLWSSLIVRRHCPCRKLNPNILMV